MSEFAFDDFSKQVLALSYEQSLMLMSMILENLKTKPSQKNEIEDDLNKMEDSITRSNMNTMWEELKNDTW